MNFKWNYQPPTPERQQQAKELAEKLGMSPILAQLLIKRGIRTESAAKRFLRPLLSELIDPFLMNDMDVAVDRLNDAMGRKERIMVYGDYDVDGCTAVALVYRFLLQFYSNIEYYIPDRYEEGYGISQKGLDHAQEAGVKLIIILDCGIKAIDEIRRAKEMGIDFIICDHHVPDDELPCAVAILNPKRQDSTYPFKDLCGCGVGFKFMQAFAKNNGIPFSQLIPLLDFCAVSIAADMVSVMGENRILAFHGLKQLNQNPSTGLKAIIEISGLTGRDITMSDIVFKIGPRINASGRVQNGTETVDLLVEKDFKRALQEAIHINEYNEQRKDIDKQMSEEANQIVERLESQEHQPAIVLYNEGWKKGVVGIVASRLTEMYYRPTVVLSCQDGMATGSARSVAGYDIYDAIKSCRDLLENFGGHTYAVGLSLRTDNIPEFRQRILNGMILEYDFCNPSYTVALPDGTYRYCLVNANQPFAQYLEEGRIKQAAAIESEHLEEEGDDVLRLLFTSSVPWLNYTEAMMPYPDNHFSIPNICWGSYKTEKYLCLEDGTVTEKVKISIPVTLLVNHALVDGRHIGQFYQNLEEELNNFDF